jgi:phosphohistidine phosphatase SixA
VLVIRHASAGDPKEWEGDDRLRPLDPKGFAQAARLVKLLDGYEISCVLSSPALRCVQTVEPFAQERGLEVQVRDELAEERQGTDGAALVQSLVGRDVAFSVHGGLSEAAFGESQKKAEVLVIDERGRVTERIRA